YRAVERVLPSFLKAIAFVVPQVSPLCIGFLEGLVALIQDRFEFLPALLRLFWVDPVGYSGFVFGKTSQQRLDVGGNDLEAAVDRPDCLAYPNKRISEAGNSNSNRVHPILKLSARAQIDSRT